MKRVGIVFFQNIRYAPYIKYYTNLLDGIPYVEYDLIYYNRDRSLNEPNGGKFIPVPWIGKGTNAASKIEKAFNFIYWRFYVTRLLRQKKYDFIIVIMTTAGVLLERYLSQNYKGKFIFDIRDYTQEHIKSFYQAEERLVKHSSLNVISSPGFKEFLPSAKYIMCHNLSDIQGGEAMLFQRTNVKPIQISYIGSISYEKQCIQLMHLVDKDQRFSFKFYGNENTSHQVSKEVNRLGNPRIQMMGPFLPSDKKRIYGESALVFNCYGNKHSLVLYAISNKHYDGALYKVPVLNSPGTIMDKMAGEFGYALDLEHLSNLNGLYDWYMALDENAYNKYAASVINNANKENQITADLIVSAITE